MSIDISLLVWTIFNFFVLMLLLNHFLYKPLLNFMRERGQRIEAGIEAGHLSQQQLLVADQDFIAKQKTMRLATQKQADDATRALLEQDKKRTEAVDTAAKHRRDQAIIAFRREQEQMQDELVMQIPKMMEIFSLRLESKGTEGSGDAINLSDH
jgi:F0F1-type ATP synthase membrane subunit b/b'